MGDSFQIYHEGDAEPTDLSGAAYGLTVVGTPKLPFFAKTKGRRQSIAQSNTDIIGADYFDSATLTLTCKVSATSWATLCAKIDNIKAVLDPRLGHCIILIDGIIDRCWSGFLLDGVDWGWVAAHANQFDLTFTLTSPMAYGLNAPDDQTVTVSSSPTSFKVPADSVPTPLATDIVPGTEAAYPEWIIKVTPGASQLILASTTTGETITLSSISAGDWVKLDRATQHITRSSDSGTTWVSAMSKVPAQATTPNIPRLAPGVQNELTLTGLSSGEIVIAYTPRYL
jgi:hypothetical protein